MKSRGRPTKVPVDVQREIAKEYAHTDKSSKEVAQNYAEYGISATSVRYYYHKYCDNKK